MPRTSDMRESKFLKQSDVGAGALGTIEDCIQMNVAKEGADHEMKWCLTFVEIEKPLVLNSTNVQLCEKILGSDNTDDWRGKKIVLYTDPNVSYGGKLVGGIRIRAPRNQAGVTATPTPVTPPPPIIADDIPF